MHLYCTFRVIPSYTVRSRVEDHIYPKIFWDFLISIEMSDSGSSSHASSGDGLKRKRTIRSSDPRKKPQLEEGTSHVSLALELAKQRLAHLKGNLLNEIGGREDTYVYTPLKQFDGEDIRVLIIEPGKGDDPIACRLVPSALPTTKSGSTKAYPYTALSYFWGEGEPIHEITMTTYKTPEEKLESLGVAEMAIVRWRMSKRDRKHKAWSNSGKIYVRSNLYVALKRFRDRREPVTMWIDALCIDQGYDPERTEQVKKMHELYINARTVSVWLGDGKNLRQPPPRPCFSFLRRLLRLGDLDDVLNDLAEDKDNLVEGAGNIISLMRNKWFSRRWVVQELALARQAEVVYGLPMLLKCLYIDFDREQECHGQVRPATTASFCAKGNSSLLSNLKYSVFADGIAVFIKSQKRILPALSKKITEKAVSLPELPPPDGVHNLGANALVDFTSNLFRRNENGDIQQRMMTLEMLVSSLLAFESGDPKDTIFAVLSLAKDTHRISKETGLRELDERLTPTYEKKCLLDVYTDFIGYCIDESKSLDILLRHWAPSGEKERKKRRFTKKPKEEEEEEAKEEPLPTWIPLISKSSHGSPSQRAGGRIGGDSFVGTYLRTGQRNYSATLDLPPSLEFGRIEAERGAEEPAHEGRQKHEQEKVKKGEEKGIRGKKEKRSKRKKRAKDRKGKENHTASQETNHELPEKKDHHNKLKKKYNGRIFVKGLRIGTIKELSPRAPQGMIFHEAFGMAKFDHRWWEEYQEWAEDIPRVPEAFLRTLVADRGPDGQNIPSWYPRAFMECLNNLWVTGDLRPDDVISLPKAPEMAKHLLVRIKDVMWERKFVRIDLNGKKDTYGLLPPQANETDVICVLFGSSVPVVLRPQVVGHDEYWEMVGECFCYGQMEGEAVSGREWKYPYDDAECFEIR
ncbi:hypothetical protein HYFRA_00003991 [Hymenoscyphus fraxineus]|uniref:Heterokaryon incompatibility domain-containing protein n=1 Tax=Hymenoscyphus fraxineus TaxID=746836 RepID=A0A9N9PNG0_9HELO|nr:hypothetical protein HYFRA_00003991 [Hymenoscyphus fraxineus]